MVNYFRIVRIARVSAMVVGLLLAPNSPGFPQQLDNSPPPGAPGYEELAHAFNKLSKGDLDGAVKFARQAHSLAPDAEAPVRLLADALTKLDRPEEALMIINDYAQSHHLSTTLLLQRANLRQRLNDFEGAAADLRTLLESGELTKEQQTAANAALFQVTLALSYASLAAGAYHEAIEAAEKARQLDTKAEAPVRALMEAYEKLGQPAEALASADRYISENVASWRLLAQRGYLRRSLNDLKGAEEDFAAALARPDLPSDQVEPLQKAVAEANLAQAGAPPVAGREELDRAYKALGAGNLELAVSEAKAAQEKDPKAEGPVLVLMAALQRLKRLRAALEEANRFADRNRPSPVLLAQRGYIRRSLLDLKGAISDFRASLSSPGLGPRQEKNVRTALAEALLALSYPAAAVAARDELDRAYKALSAGVLELAIKEAKAAQEKDPKAEGPVLVLMAALQRLGRPRSAIEEANRFAEHNQPSPVLLAQRGYIRRSLSDLRGAISDFQASLASPGLDKEQEKNVRAALAEARLALSRPGARAAASAAEGLKPVERALNRAYEALKMRDLREAVQAAREARRLDPSSDTAALVLMDSLSRLGEKKAAIAEADRFLRANPPNAKVLAQKGFLRRQTKDVAGAISDFSRALSLGTLPAAQKKTVLEALDEARYFLVADKAFKASAARDWLAALKYSRMAQKFRRADEAVSRISIEALAQLKRFDEALKESNVLIARGKTSGQAYAQRGFLREQIKDHWGAAADFSTALKRAGLPPAQRKEIERALAVATSKALEAQGDIAGAFQALFSFALDNPGDAKIWDELGRFYSRQKWHKKALVAFENSLAIKRKGEILLSAGYESVYVNRAKESLYFREALDRWSSDVSLRARPKRDHEVVKVQVVEADATIRTTVVYGNILGRRKRWGGYQHEPSFETALRFDGRYLPYLLGLEGFVGGRWSQDQTRFTESFSRLGLRLRPFDGINFSISAEYQHRFDPRPLNQVALSWAYGYGGFAYSSVQGGAAEASAVQGATTTNYPFESGWRPLTSFSTFGTFRVAERRYLQDALGLLGYSYWSASPFRFVAGPAAMAQASYDNLAKRRLALGLGPSVIFRAWTGGDQYRAYDGLITLQVGYLFPFAASRRQGGLKIQLSLTF
jgi:tetratricopeptide (TPR) repeat protein